MANRDTIAEAFRTLQDDICAALEEADGKAQFEQDLWERPGGGGGRTRVLQNGQIVEKGGVNFSAVHGTLPENIRQALKVKGEAFFATGVSIVLHPESPRIPIIHMNVRYFEIENETWWFGGGIDLTPIYVVEEDARFFHTQLKQVCDQHDPEYYPRFKNWADDYFYIKHRKETRGIGGIFFDRLSGNRADVFDYVKAVGETFAPTYCELINRNRDLPYADEQKQWQMQRRGRYVEFNLVYDKGTKFGLETDGRIESILMSLPLQAGWPYKPTYEAGTEEQKTLDRLVKGLDWTL